MACGRAGVREYGTMPRWGLETAIFTLLYSRAARHARHSQHSQTFGVHARISLVLLSRFVILHGETGQTGWGTDTMPTIRNLHRLSAQAVRTGSLHGLR